MSAGSGPPVAVFSGGGTGGHLYPALALAEALRELRPDVQTFFVGARRGLESKILPEKGLDHLLLPIRGFARRAPLRNLVTGLLLIRSIVAVGHAFSRLRPGVVVVTGGYAGGPAGIVAGLMGIPLAIQEQNAVPGLTTRILARWSKQIHLAFPEARKHLPEEARPRATLSGNPIRVPPSLSPGEARSRLGLEPEAVVLLVTGGSQGAAAINQAVMGMVEDLLEGRAKGVETFRILWATGPAHVDRIHARLAELGSPAWVRAVGYIHDMPLALTAASVALGRAGAMTTSEFLAWGIPAVLVPLPTAAADHQTRNAESLAAAGAAVHLPETALSGASLWEAVHALLTRPSALESLRHAALERGRPHATGEIACAIASLMADPAYVRAGAGS